MAPNNDLKIFSNANYRSYFFRLVSSVRLASIVAEVKKRFQKNLTKTETQMN